MSPAAEPTQIGLRSFRSRLLVAMMLVVSILTSLGIYLAQRREAADARDDLQRDFQLELSSSYHLQELRNAAVADRSAALARNARIHAALEDNALDLLYPSAAEELRDLMEREPASGALHAEFYRFLDSRGAVIPAPGADAGALSPGEQAQLAQPTLSSTTEVGYLARGESTASPTIEEMIAVPIRSTESNEVIAALVLGFKPVEAIARNNETRLKSGIFTHGRLQLPGIDHAGVERLTSEISEHIARGADAESSLRVTLGNLPHQLFFKRLNPNSAYSPAYEVCIYPLTDLSARQRHLRTQILIAGGALLAAGFFVSHLISRRLSRPVEKLAVVSEENRAQRQQAEAKLLTTTEELQRSARFSADASHQLKSPIAVLRVGLDSLLAHDGLPSEVYEEISSLIHQTYRLTGVVEDLLLLSRMDAGRLRLNLGAVNLSQLVEEWIEDLRALPETGGLQLDVGLPNDLQIAGEKKYTSLVVQNLLDNARKYNHPRGAIRIRARATAHEVELRVANTGGGIPPGAQPHIFERFHRAGAGEDVPGHGLGLNLARQLVRLHGGELRLLRSDGEWTEFSVTFAAASARNGTPQVCA